MKTLVIATRNLHKVQEIKAILGNSHRYCSLGDLPGSPEVVEDSGTFAGNATKKAVELAAWLSSNRSEKIDEGGEEVFVLADDSGLEVDALRGAPGVHSARFAALDSGKPGNSLTRDNNAKLLRLMEQVPAERRSARFRCVIALTHVPRATIASQGSSPVCYADEAEIGTRLFEGTCEGSIIHSPRGTGGFGYDPLFVPEGLHETFGELSEEVKNRLSHRARALQKLRLAISSGT